MKASQEPYLALFFTDIEGSTKLARKLGIQYTEVIEQHDEIVRYIIEIYGGREIEYTGDGFFVTFADPVQAVNAAADIQKTVSSHHWPPGCQVRIRMALHWARPLISSKGITGLEVHRASRVCDAGYGEQVLLTDTMAQAIGKESSSTWSVRKLGAFSLKDFREPNQLYQLVIPGLRAKFPKPKTGVHTPIVAVLPFPNPDKEQDYLGEGIAEEIIITLGFFSGLKVVSRTSSFALKGQLLNAQELGKCLKATAIVEGSVKKINDRIRISAALVDVESGLNLWSGRFEGLDQDIFELQDQIAKEIAQALEIQIAPELTSSWQALRSNNTAAYDYYLRGRKFYFGFSLKEVQFAIDMFLKATQYDATYAMAFAGLADCYAYLYMYQHKSAETLEKANSYCHRAIELDPQLAQGHVSCGLVFSLSKKYHESAQSFEKALELNPLLFEAYYQYARMAFAQGDLTKAGSLFEVANRLQPEDFQSILLAAQCFQALGLQDRAIRAQKKGVKTVEEILNFNPGDSRALYMGANALAHLGEKRRAIQYLDRALAIESNDAMTFYNAGCVYALLDEQEKALHCLERSVATGITQREWYDNDPDLDTVRKSVRFAELIKLTS